MIPNPVILVGGAALALWLLLGGKKEEAIEPAPPPPPPPVKKSSVPVIDEAGKTYTATETQVWFDEGYAIGYAHGSNGRGMTVEPALKYPDSEAQQELYRQYYTEGYRVGYNLGSAEFAAVDPSATKPSIEGSFGKQPNKSAGNTGPIIDFSTTRGAWVGNLMNSTPRAARPRRW